ncbi:uncharacterized protein LOC132185581 [Corylus avellana]|uniref:uncharacterized protein LOC132185581 n=1 Tax=Corylus avellana TaxID=13451 RepID=UPI001E233068|nr:uncharacterized protein LOC132185581 [Corylus avellana]
MLTDEFSFPKITSNTIPDHHFTISASPWRDSSLVYPDYNLDEGNYGRGESFSRKSFSYLESKMKREILDAAASPETSEEKMDMLWEDFNEELQRVSKSSMDKKKEAERLSTSGATEEMQEFCGLQALKIPKTSRKRPNMMVVMKILKKLLLLRMRNSPQIKQDY